MDGEVYISRFSRTEAAELFGLTPRALRYYEARGLPGANHRSYDALARLRLRWIAALRAAGVGLIEIEAASECSVRDDVQRKVPV